MAAQKNHRPQSSEVNTFLKSELAHLWPAINNITQLQKVCAATLPQLFSYCEVLNLANEQLVIAAPSAAFASKLKQQLPRLQMALQEGGWQIQAIRIKVKTKQVMSTESIPKQCHLSDKAIRALNSLERNLAHAHPEGDLVSALRTLLARHKM